MSTTQQHDDEPTARLTTISMPDLEPQQYANVVGVIVLSPTNPAILLVDGMSPAAVHTLGHMVNRLSVQMVENPESVLPHPDDPRWQRVYVIYQGEAKFKVDGTVGQVDGESRIFLGFGHLQDGSTPVVDMHTSVFLQSDTERADVVGMWPVWVQPQGTIEIDRAPVTDVKMELVLMS